jgi:Xaa-Pro aminopeptidase
MHSDFFGGLGPRTNDTSIFQLRRKDLYEAVNIKNKYQDEYDGEDEDRPQSYIVLFAAFEMGHERFVQDKTFFYYTGINEPGAVLVIDAEGKSTLYLPNYYAQRSKWMTIPAAIMNKDHKALGFDAIKDLGRECDGYQLSPYFSRDDYESLMDDVLGNIIWGEDYQKGKIFSTKPSPESRHIAACIAWTRIECFAEHFFENPHNFNHFDYIDDISPIIGEQRRHKDLGEVEKIYRAVEVTQLAQEAAVRGIKDGALECEVQASLEYIMTASNARTAFPSIVASGANSTILHHSENSGTLKNGDLVIIDVGAQLDSYCADLTRTYPVSGRFTKRQKELYNTVLDTQEYIAGLAKPGMWLKNKDRADKSLHHLAQAFLEKRGYAHYFTHGIGHYLGLDVHDVGSYDEPLHEGDVITIEPGIYIKEENIGIRIEDNYWITKEGAMCLSEDLPKDVEDIEEFMAQVQSEEVDDSESDEDYLEDDEEEYDSFE